MAASPFLAKPIQMSFSGSAHLLKSPPARARHCALVGGYVRKGEQKEARSCGEVVRVALGTSPRQPSQAALVPFRHSPLSRGALRSAGVLTFAASTTPAPWPARRLTAGRARHLGRPLSGAREHPVCAEGWAMWVPGGSPDLSKATGGTYRLGMPQG